MLVDFWSENGSTLVPNPWKINTNCEKRFFDKSCSRCSGGLIREVLGVEVGSKKLQKTIQTRGRHGKASWHRFLMDFGGFGEASWEGKSSQEASKMASKKRWKNEGQQDGQKVVIRIRYTALPLGSWSLGRSPPWVTRRYTYIHIHKYIYICMHT